MRFAFFLWFVSFAAGCIVEDKPIAPPGDGGVDAGSCGICPVVRPVCTDALECVQCTADDDDYCTERSLICDLDSSTCIECTGDRDCTDPAAARCDTGICVPCTENEQCDQVDGLDGKDNACNEEGLCVDCTPETEVSTCDQNRACDPATNECTEIRVGALDVCEECVADSQCGDDENPSDAHRCVPMFYLNPEARFPDSDTGFCLKTTAGGCERPYSVTLFGRSSLSDPTAEDDYCGINEDRVTCPAVLALLSDIQCPSGADDECPIGGICRDVGSLQDRCTYLCELPAQCPAGAPADTCPDSGGGENYCGD